MDRYGGDFGAYGNADADGFDEPYDFADSSPVETPPSPVGQDERRMQVRAYNHWARFLDTSQFPLIDNLKPETLDDFGPHGVLLDFSGRTGIENPAIRFLGAKLADECGGADYRRLSDVPSGSLLSRITDHYLQILANQAPIGFEAEFVNTAGATVLYRGILLPWSSDGVGIDFIFGVINWKELADAATAEALLQALDAALATPGQTDEGNDMDRLQDLSGFSGNDGEAGQEADDAGAPETPITLPRPSFGTTATRAPLNLSAFAGEAYDEDEEDEEEDEDSAVASEWGAGFSGFGDEESSYAVDYGDQGLEDGEGEEDDYDGVIDPLAADDGASLGLVSLVSRSLRNKASVDLSAPAHSFSYEPAPAPIPQAFEATAPEPEWQPEPEAAQGEPVGASTGEIRTELSDPIEPSTDEDHAAEEPFELDASFEVLGDFVEEAVAEPETAEASLETLIAAQFALEEPAGEAIVDEPEAIEPVAQVVEEQEEQPAPRATEIVFPDEEPEGLYDTLAAARELAQTARSSEDRGRKALYQAVSRAYDFSLEAWANPEDFAELLSDNGLTMQDRAPMTPVVKLVFGADYDKTRLTEYATVLGFAHRTGVARGTLDAVLAKAEGGLKGIVQAERNARRDGGEAVAAPRGLKESIAKRLRKLDTIALEDLPEDGAEFALVMVRRLPSGELVVVGEVPDNVALVEKAAKALLG